MLPDSLRDNSTAAALDDLATSGNLEFGELTIEVAPENILAVLTRLKEKLGYNRLSTITGVDLYPAEPRFGVVYHIQSIATRQRIRIKTRVPGNAAELDSACSVYPSANWYERETFDFFGIRFLNHPDLKRIMLPEDFEGNPLRKDFPVTGLRY
jgi:NADH-quinone oxidoreductase subunit C